MASTFGSLIYDVRGVVFGFLDVEEKYVFSALTCALREEASGILSAEAFPPTAVDVARYIRLCGCVLRIALPGVLTLVRKDLSASSNTAEEAIRAASLKLASSGVASEANQQVRASSAAAKTVREKGRPQLVLGVLHGRWCSAATCTACTKARLATSTLRMLIGRKKASMESWYWPISHGVAAFQST